MNLSQEDWAKSINKFDNSVVIDVRTTEEFEEGFINNSIHLNIYDSQHFLEGINKLYKNHNIHVYCRSGARSFQACELMNQLGFKHVYNLDGGILEWKGKILKK